MSAAWYHGSRADFLLATRDFITGQLATRAAEANLETPSDQAKEWKRSIGMLQRTLKEGIPILRQALLQPGNEEIHDVILEYDFRRRGLRMDCVLLAKGAIFVVEFKRSKLGRSDRDQVMGYAVNLLEFHRVTREWTERTKGIVVPVLVQTKGTVAAPPLWPGFNPRSWPALADAPVETDAKRLGDALSLGLQLRRGAGRTEAADWLSSPFSPSSSIIDATISLFGNHDVAAISEHAAPKDAIDRSTAEIREHIRDALVKKANHIVFLSGAPGAGKTLVGLDIVMRGTTAGDTVFVTGNVPLVKVLNRALSNSYRSSARGDIRIVTGYHRKDMAHVIGAASYKIVKAHQFLGDLSDKTHRQMDGRILVFDEAQRTYKKGRIVIRKRLPDHEANLILALQARSYPQGAVVLALIGHNQAINSGELGMIAWLRAAETKKWTYSISEETLSLLRDEDDPEHWRTSSLRKPLTNGHLAQSMRFYRNAAVEGWAAAVLDGKASAASKLARQLSDERLPILITRDLASARMWARSNTVGGARSGIIASAQAKRLAAEGLFVDLETDIATWMLASTGDVRSSSGLEVVQNQFQVQGLELDYCIVCWDADLRREANAWKPYKFRGAGWQNDSAEEVVKNSYRVLLTRARKGMVIFVPRGDDSGHDETRRPAFYDGIAGFLEECGAQPLD
jgi:hypothetical protein